MTAKGYWLAFGIGVIAGAAVALLYAPQTGTKTRKQLKRSFEDAGDYLEDAGDYLKSQAERLSNEAQAILRRTKGQVDDAVETASDFAGSAAKNVNDFAGTTAKQVRSMV